MGEEIAIVLSNVSKCFKRYDRPVDRLKELLLPGKSRANEFWALQDINLEVFKGETLGIIGRNGSGKSTLLQIIAGTLMPTTGEIKVNGRISALLELGSGFNPEFTGRQNVFFNGRLLGLSQKEIEDRFDEIASFADIGDFIEQPVKTYSSGMFVRLAFAVAINVNPEVLIVDEALSVGDGVFVHRCMAKIKDFQDSGGTILFVSHDLGAVSRLCSRCCWIDSSRIVEQGLPVDVSKSYQSWIYEKINEGFKSNAENQNDLVVKSPEKVELLEPQTETDTNQQFDRETKINPFTNQLYLALPKVQRFGTGKCEIIEFDLWDCNNKTTRFILPGETLKVYTKILCHDRINNPIVGVTIFDRLRVSITAWNTTQCEYKLSNLSQGQIISVTFTIKWPHLKSDNYTLEPAIADGSQENHEMLDWLQNPISLQSGVTDLMFGLLKFTDMSISHTITQTTNFASKVLENSLSR